MTGSGGRRPGPGDTDPDRQERDVVGEVGIQSLEDLVAQFVHRTSGKVMGDGDQAVHALVERRVPALHQPVGVEDDGGPGGSATVWCCLAASGATPRRRFGGRSRRVAVPSASRSNGAG